MRRIGDALVICTNRHGGVSAPPFASLNLSHFTDDDAAAVRTNWERALHVLRSAGVDPSAGVEGIAWLYQVHGADARVVSFDDLPGPGPGAEGDALVTSEVGLPLSVMGADCASVALVAPGAVAAVHAGWRGLAAGVIGAAVDRLRDVGARAGGGDVRAVLGPCIRVGAYEFGSGPLEDLVHRFGPSVRGVTRDGAPAFDLPAAVRSELARAGVADLDDVEICTATSPDYFSHRRDARTGRQAMIVTRRA